MSKVTVYVQPQPISDRLAVVICGIISSSVMGAIVASLFLIPGFAPFFAGALFGFAIRK